MKSYLVDALRRAEEEDGDTTADKKRVAEAENPLIASGEVGCVEASEFELLEIRGGAAIGRG